MGSKAFTVQEGDSSFRPGPHHIIIVSLSGGALSMKVQGKFFREVVDDVRVESAEILSEERIQSMSGSVGAGVAGAILLGPLGMIAGNILGGRSEEAVFECRLDDGRSFTGVVDKSMLEAFLYCKERSLKKAAKKAAEKAAKKAAKEACAGKLANAASARHYRPAGPVFFFAATG